MSIDFRISTFEVMLPLPNNKVELAGFFPPRKWDGTGGDLCAAFILLEPETGKNILLGSVDVLYLDTALNEALSMRLADEYHLVLSATHTHSAPGLAKSVERLGCVDSGWYEQVLDKLVSAISTATGKNTLTQINAGALSSDLNVNRRRDALMLDYGAMKRGKLKFGKQVALAANLEGPVDNHVRSICLSDASGQTRACLWSLGAHPSFKGSRHAISPDFPGVVRRRIKQEYGEECVSIFFPGLAGSAIPNCAEKSFRELSAKEKLLSCLPLHVSRRPFDPAAYLAWGEKLANQVIAAAAQSTGTPLDQLKITSHSLKTPPIFEDETRGALCMDMHGVMFGDVAEVVVVNGELLAEWDTLFDEQSLRGTMSIISGYGAGNCLYIPPEREMQRGGYEVDRFKFPFGLKGDFCGDIDAKILNGLRQILKKDAA